MTLPSATLGEIRSESKLAFFTGSNPSSRIGIEGSEFANNTVDYRRLGSLGHNIYIGNSDRFGLVNSYVHDASVGHNVKSRARENFILYNRIIDESADSGYLLDLPNGGDAYLLGNLFRQGPRNGNQPLISFAAESNRESPGQSLHAVNNTAVNNAVQGVFVANYSIAPARLVNNLWVGSGRLLRGPGELSNNLQSTQPMFRDTAGFDYRLLPDAAAIDAGIDPGKAGYFSLVPRYQYQHPRKIEPRPAVGALDIGAFEYVEPYGSESKAVDLAGESSSM